MGLGVGGEAFKPLLLYIHTGIDGEYSNALAFPRRGEPFSSFISVARILAKTEWKLHTVDRTRFFRRYLCEKRATAISSGRQEFSKIGKASIRSVVILAFGLQNCSDKWRSYQRYFVIFRLNTRQCYINMHSSPILFWLLWRLLLANYFLGATFVLPSLHLSLDVCQKFAS